MARLLTSALCQVPARRDQRRVGALSRCACSVSLSKDGVGRSCLSPNFQFACTLQGGRVKRTAEGVLTKWGAHHDDQVHCPQTRERYVLRLGYHHG
jgi:hypothetical protein